MPEEREILRYELDISDAERKAEDLQRTLANIETTRASGGDSSSLEKQAIREGEALGALTGKAEETGEATKDLLRQKEKLGAVVRILGGRFGGMVSDMASVVELMKANSAAAGVLGAALAALAIGATFYSKMRADLQALIELQREYNQLITESQTAALGPQSAIDQLLANSGGLTAGTANAAGITANRLGREFGVAPNLAGPAGAFGTLAGLSFADTGILAAGMARGAQIGSGSDATRFIGQLTPEARGQLQSELDAIRHTVVGREAQSQAEAAQTARGRTPANRLFERMKKLGNLPPGITSGPELEEYLGDLPSLAKRLAVADAATKLGSGVAGEAGRLFFEPKRDRLQIEFNRALILRDMLNRDVRRDRGLIGGNTDLPELPVGPIPAGGGAQRFIEQFNQPQSQPAPPRIGDFSVPPSPPTVINHIRIGTLNARPGRGWLRRGGQAGFGTGSFNIASGGST